MCRLAMWNRIVLSVCIQWMLAVALLPISGEESESSQISQSGQRSDYAALLPDE